MKWKLDQDKLISFEVNEYPTRLWNMYYSFRRIEYKSRRERSYDRIMGDISHQVCQEDILYCISSMIGWEKRRVSTKDDRMREAKSEMLRRRMIGWEKRRVSTKDDRMITNDNIYEWNEEMSGTKIRTYRASKIG